MGQGLENVRKLYLEGIAGGDARKAVYAYTGHRYTQHSTGVGDGREGFLAFFEPFLERNPKREIEIVRILEDGPWVFCSAYQSLNDGDAQWVTMDLFFTDPEGLILEHWDTIAAFEPNTQSGENMVGGTTEIDHSADTQTSKSIVLEYTKQVLQGGRHDRIDAFVSNELVQHAASIDRRLSGLSEWLSSDAYGQYEMLFKLVGQGDHVVTYGKRRAKGEDIAVFDVYRIENGLIAEHWMNEEVISPRESWGNSGKF